MPLVTSCLRLGYQRVTKVVACIHLHYFHLGCADVRREDLAPKEPYVHKQKRRLAAPPAHVIRGEAPKRSQHT
jgi:hypothetical protein